MTGGKRWRVGAAGAVIHQGRVFMVRSTYGKGKGRWMLPGGYTTHDERLDQTVPYLCYVSCFTHYILHVRLA
jgi:8-oxo-dGTP pyrophosphatase MutT (NUDIX family)